MRYLLIGKMNKTYKSEAYTNSLAVFESEKLISDYVKNSLLKNPTYYNKYKKLSLLSGYDGYEIKDLEPERDLPLNPKI